MSNKIKNYVILYCEDWDTDLKTSKHHFIERLAKENNKILYLEVPLNLYSYISKPKEYFDKKHLNLFRGLREVKKIFGLLNFLSHFHITHFLEYLQIIFF